MAKPPLGGRHPASPISSDIAISGESMPFATPCAQLPKGGTMTISGMPIYLNVANTLREQIDHGFYASGKELPSESKLARDFNCGRDTIRAAIKVLIDEA